MQGLRSSHPGIASFSTSAMLHCEAFLHPRTAVQLLEPVPESTLPAAGEVPSPFSSMHDDHLCDLEWAFQHTVDRKDEDLGTGREADGLQTVVSRQHERFRKGACRHHTVLSWSVW